MSEKSAEQAAEYAINRQRHGKFLLDYSDVAEAYLAGYEKGSASREGEIAGLKEDDPYGDDLAWIRQKLATNEFQVSGYMRAFRRGKRRGFSTACEMVHQANRQDVDDELAHARAALSAKDEEIKEIKEEMHDVGECLTLQEKYLAVALKDLDKARAALSACEEKLGIATQNAIDLLHLYERTGYRPKDHACSKCIQEEHLSGGLVIEDFRCAYHAVKPLTQLSTQASGEV